MSKKKFASNMIVLQFIQRQKKNLFKILAQGPGVLKKLPVIESHVAWLKFNFLSTII